MKRQKVDVNANSFASCPETYYCEYFSAGGYWHIVGANTESGYYCPAHPPVSPGPAGDFMCTEQYRLTSKTPEFVESEHYVEYDYVDGEFRISQASCPAGFMAPSDPIEFAKRTGKLRIHPVRMVEDGGKKVDNIA